MSYDSEVLRLYDAGRENMTDVSVGEVVQKLLQATDYMGLSDTPAMTSEWAAYRATLRGLKNSGNWPVVEPDEWPQRPTEGSR